MSSSGWRSVRRGILCTAAAVAVLAGSTTPAGSAPPLPGDPSWSLVHDEAVGHIAVTTNVSGEVHAFASDSQGTFFVHRWDATGTTSEVIVLDPSASPRLQPVAVSRGDDVFVFAVEPDGIVYQVLSAGVASGWIDLGGRARGVPVAVTDGDGDVHVFVVGADGSVWHQELIGDTWSGWESMGGFAWNVGAAVNGDAVEVTVFGSNNGMYHATVTESGFVGWTELGGRFVQGWQFSPDPAMITDGDGTWAVAVGQDQALWANHLSPGGVWSGPVSLGGIVVGTPSIATLPARTVVVARGQDDAAYVQRLVPDTEFGWQRLGGEVFDVAATHQGDRIRVYARGLIRGDLGSRPYTIDF